MRTFLLACVFALIPVFAAFGQPTPPEERVSVIHFVRDFGDHEIYQTFATFKEVTWVTTVRMKDGVCKMLYVSSVDLDEDGIEFKGGTTWELKKVNGKELLRIELPPPKGDSLKVIQIYKRTDKDPLRFCLSGQRI